MIDVAADIPAARVNVKKGAPDKQQHLKAAIKASGVDVVTMEMLVTNKGCHQNLGK